MKNIIFFLLLSLFILPGFSLAEETNSGQLMLACIENPEGEECEQYSQEMEKLSEMSGDMFSGLFSGLADAALEMQENPMMKEAIEKQMLQADEMRLVGLVGTHCDENPKGFECGYWKEKLDAFNEKYPDLI